MEFTILAGCTNIIRCGLALLVISVRD